MWPTADVLSRDTVFLRLVFWLGTCQIAASQQACLPVLIALPFPYSGGTAQVFHLTSQLSVNTVANLFPLILDVSRPNNKSEQVCASHGHAVVANAC